MQTKLCLVTDVRQMCFPILVSRNVNIVHVPYNSVCADNKLWSGVPLVVGDVVVGLKPNPLLAFGEESVVAGLSFAILHYCRHTGRLS